MSKDRPTYQQLVERLAVAEPIVEALKHHQVDAVVGQEKIAFLLLREVREELVTCEAGFRSMFDLPGVGMIQADTPALRFSRVNQKLCQMTGYSPQELLTQTYISLTHPQDRRRDMKALAQVLRGEADSWSIEKRCVCKDGSFVWVSVHGGAVRDETGRVIKIMAMISDISARKQAEQEQRDTEEELKKRVQERTAELSRTIEQLQQQVAKRKLAKQGLDDKAAAQEGKPIRHKTPAVSKPGDSAGSKPPRQPPRKKR